MRCCAQDDDRGQVEVMKVMMVKSVVIDMHEMDPQNKACRRKKAKTQG